VGREEGLREEGQKGNPEGVKEEGQEKIHAFIHAYACMLLRGQVCAGSYFVLFSFVHTPMGRALYGKGRKQKLRKERLRPCSQLALNIGILLRWVLRGGSWVLRAQVHRRMIPMEKEDCDGGKRGGEGEAEGGREGVDGGSDGGGE